jgi:carotenoid cleavage dioxygenase-like enzyme
MTEAPISVQFDPDTLDILGYSDRFPGTFATAHPHRDPDSGALINLATHMGPVNRYRFFIHAPGHAPRVLGGKAVRRPGYVHSFAMSRRHLALTEFPFTVNPTEIPLGGRPFIENFRWHPERPTRIVVFDRTSRAMVGVYETDAGFAFHHVGAWEDGDTLIMEYCDHGSPRIIDALYLDRLRSPKPSGDGRRAPPRLRRVQIDLSRNRVSSEYRSEHDIELPRINEQAHYLRQYRYVYGIASGPDNDYDTADRLVKIDNQTGEATTWREEGIFVGEPIFVAAPDPRGEDEGVILSVVLDALHSESHLVVLNASSMTELARVRAPHVIPHGIHGAFYPST